MPEIIGDTMIRAEGDSGLFCWNCGDAFSRLYRLSPFSERWRCSSCHAQALEEQEPEAVPYPEDDPYADPAEAETSTDDVDRVMRGRPVELLIPELDGRKARMVSVEQEIGRGGEWVARKLYSHGLSPYSRMQGYHSGASGFAYVEQDASVDGEVIWSRMSLDTPDHARQFRRGLSVIREGIRNDDVRLDMRCGLHIHVDLRGYSAPAVVSLYHLWNYLEDTIFRLGSANWRCHRTEVAHENYAPKTWKTTSGVDAIRELDSARGALNLGNYLYARSRCSCGAFGFGLWEECTCNLNKATVEFRVFNASANPRKIRAYIALSLALVAFAEREKVAPQTFPVWEWHRTEQTYHRSESDWLDGSEKRMSFLLDELPLNRNERESLVYCAERSSLAPVIERMRG